MQMYCKKTYNLVMAFDKEHLLDYHLTVTDILAPCVNTMDSNFPFRVN